MLFYKVLILFCFGGVLEHALMFGGSLNVHYYNTFLLSLTQTASISSGFDEGPPSEKRNVVIG